jgi:HSP20 family protein
MTRLATGRAISNLERQLNSIFNYPFVVSGRAEDLGFAGAGPAIDIMEDQEAFYLTADLPGFSKDNIQLRYENRALTLSGERHPEEISGARCHRAESFNGKFQRSFTLPLDIDVEKIKAELKNGVLTITLPKQEASKPRQISVKVG